MMLTGENFTEMDKLALEFLSSYDLFHFPLDIFNIVKKVFNAEIKSYSTLENEKLESLKEKNISNKGYTVFEHLSNGDIHYIIYINDSDCLNRQRFTLAHEVKHILLNEEDFDIEQEILADYFAKALLAPKCVVFEMNCFSREKISSKFGLSYEASQNWLNAINNRVSIMGKWLLNFEKEYIKLFKNNN